MASRVARRPFGDPVELPLAATELPQCDTRSKQEVFVSRGEALQCRLRIRWFPGQGVTR